MSCYGRKRVSIFKSAIERIQTHDSRANENLGTVPSYADVTAFVNPPKKGASIIENFHPMNFVAMFALLSAICS